MLSILIPTYNGSQTLAATLESILSQNFTDFRHQGGVNFEIIICDDGSTDRTAEVVKSFSNESIKFFAFTKNIGYPGNLNRCLERASGEVIFLMGQDDILAVGALLKTYQVFLTNPAIGAVTRPYFWFDQDIHYPVRVKKQLNPKQDEIVRITDGYQKIKLVFETLDQLSGLAYRKEFMEMGFHQDIFPCHIYPFAAIFKKHPIVFLKDYTVAVSIKSSQSRHLPSIYHKSPMQSWRQMFENIFLEPQFQSLKEYLIKNLVAKNYIGLVQIKNYARFKYLLREIWLLLKYRPANILSGKFWFFSLGCLLVPRFILRPLVDWYKEKINARLIKGII